MRCACRDRNSPHSRARDNGSRVVLSPLWSFRESIALAPCRRSGEPPGPRAKDGDDKDTDNDNDIDSDTDTDADSDAEGPQSLAMPLQPQRGGIYQPRAEPWVGRVTTS